MKWEGGKRPVSSGSMVNFVARGDVVILVGIAGSIEWHHCGEESDIIAYRLINQQTVQLDNPEIEPSIGGFIDNTFPNEIDGKEEIEPCNANWNPLRTRIDPPKKMYSHIECGFDSFISVEDAKEYMAENAATSKQSAPKGSGNPILGMVLADLTNRALEGKEKYGEPLKAHNGRNALWDLYQELLDAAMYTRQLIEEQAE